ncbi:MAG: hypothetical protein WAV93_06765 [Bacteroidales bacterium]
MKIIKYLSLVVAVTLLASCEKHEVEFLATPIDNMAEFQLHYMNPVTAVAANNIMRVEVNGKLVANEKAPLNTYNAIPSGSVGKFYTVNPGNVNIKLYLKTKLTPVSDSLVYDQSTTLTTGKQNVFVHDFTQPMIVFDNGFPYERRETVTTDSTAWIKFYNFLYETAGVPTTKLIQYQYVDARTSALVNIGPPVAFGESTGWQQVTVVKTDIVSSGSRTMTYKMKEVDSDGNIIGDLMIMNTSGTYVAYSGTLTTFIGRRYHQIMAGFRAVRSPNSSVRTFTAL